MLDSRRLAVLRAVAVRGSIAEAARQLAFTPSAVSQQISALEREVGRPLLERHPRGVRLTEAGELLVARAERIQAELEAATAELARLGADPMSTTLRLAAFPSAVAAIVPIALTALERSHPGLRVELVEAEPSRSIPALTLGEIDVAVVETDVEEPQPTVTGVDAVELFDEPFVLVAKRRLLPDVPVRLADLADRQWVAPPPTTFCGRALSRSAARAGFEPDVRFEVVELGTQIAIAASGLAVALMPALAVRPADRRQVAVHPIASPQITRRVFALARRSARGRPSVGVVIDALRAAARIYR